MIKILVTESIMLISERKRKLKHIAIDNNIYVSEMLIDAAKDILNNNKVISIDFVDDSYDSFTLKIDKKTKKRIKNFCLAKNVKIKNFWNEAAYIAIKKNKGGKIIEND